MKLPPDLAADLLARADRVGPSVKLPCPACGGKGDLLYEPGLIVSECPRCRGTGRDDHNPLSEPFVDDAGLRPTNIPEAATEDPPTRQGGEEGARTPRESEKAFQARVVTYAESRGWVVWHCYDSRRSAPGFPDLVLVRDRVLFVELKATRGRLTRDQTVWLSRLSKAGAEAFVWRPIDWPEIQECLR